MEYIKMYEHIPIFENEGYMELWDFSNANACEEARIETVSKVASVCYDKDGKVKSPEKLYEHLHGLNQSSLEFIRWVNGYSGAWSESQTSTIAASYRNSKFATWDKLLNYDTLNSTTCHKETIACFKMRVPLKVVQHLLRHRQFSFQQKSFRYVKITDKDIYWNLWLFGKTDINDCMKLSIKQHMQKAISYYNYLVDNGVKKSDARDVLPQALFTEIWIMGEVEGLANFFYERLGPRVMEETNYVARRMHEFIRMHQSILFGKIEKKREALLEKYKKDA